MASDHQYGIPVQVWNQLLALLSSQPKVETVILFGSRAKGTHRPASDIDLCLHARQLSLSEKLALDNAIDDLLLPWKVDLIDWDTIDNPDLQAHIQRLGVKLPLQVRSAST